MHRRNRGVTVATEILYCARCHRVILPREIDRGEYHFVDGDPVCRECFTRLSRRLRPLTGQRAESEDRPIPVNLADLEKELAKGTDGTQEFTPVVVRERIPTTSRLSGYRSYRKPQTIFMASCFLLGLVAGTIIYASSPIRDATGPHGRRPPPRTGGGTHRGGNGNSPGPTAAAPRKAPEGGYMLLPEADTSVRSGIKRNYGTEPLLTLARDAKVVTAEALLRFDLGAIRKPVRKARLHLGVALMDSGSALPHEVLSIPGTEWNEVQVNWTSRPGAGEVIGRWSLAPGANTALVDVTAAVSEAVRAGRPKLAICLRLADGTPAGSRAIYHSRENREKQGPALLVWPGEGKLVVAPPDGGEKPPDDSEKAPDLSGVELPIPAGALAIAPEADGYVVKGKAHQKDFGKGRRLRVERLGDHNSTTLLRFDLAAADRPVEKASLLLYPVKVGSPRNGTIRHGIRSAPADGWTEDDLDWQKAGGVSAPDVADPWEPREGRPVEIDVTRRVAAALSGKHKLALRIESLDDVGEGGTVAYLSREGHPRLAPTLVMILKKPVKQPDPDPAEKPLKKRYRLAPEADTYIYAGEKKLNNGTDAELRVSNYGPGTDRRAFLRFDLSKVAGRVTGAELRLFPLKQSGKGIAPVHQVSPVADNSWQEYKLNGKSPPKAGKAVTKWDPSAGKPVLIPLTHKVVEALEHDRKISLEISAPHGSPREIVIYYGSREGAEEHRPVLIITSEVRPGQEPPPPPGPKEKPEPPPSAGSSGKGVAPERQPPAGKSETRKPPAKGLEPGDLTAPAARVPGSLSIIAPSADTYLTSGGRASRNYGSYPSLEVGSNNRIRSEALVRFNLEKVKGSPARAVVTLEVDSLYGIRPDPIRHEALLQGPGDWDEHKITWKDRPQEGKPVARWSVRRRGQTVSFDVTGQVRRALEAKQRGMTFLIRARDKSKRQSDYVRYGSRESTGSGPRLVVLCGAPRPGLKARFYAVPVTEADIPELSARSPAVYRTDAQLNYPLKSGAWAGLSGKLPQSFAARHIGILLVDSKGTYTFHLSSDDGSRLWIDEALLIDHGGVHEYGSKSAGIELKAGYHLLRTEFFTRGGKSGLVLEYEGPGVARQVVPAAKLFHIDRSEDDLIAVKCAADTYVTTLVRSSGVRAKAYGRHTRLQASPSSDVYMRFDLATIKPPISSARLKLNPYGHFGARQPALKLPLAVFLVPASNWDEGTMNHENRSRYTQMIGGLLADRNKPVELDLTAWVKRALTGDKMLSICIRPARGFPANDSAVFCSRENRGGRAPQLLIVPKLPARQP